MKTSQDNICQCLCLCGRTLLIHVSIGDPQPLTGSLAQSLWGYWLLSPGQGLVCALQEWSLFPLPCGSFVVKSHWTSDKIPWGFPVPLQDPQVEKPGLGSRTVTTVWEIITVLQFVGLPPGRCVIWFVCSCTPPTVLWLLLCPWTWLIYLSLFFFFLFFGRGGFQHPLVKSCSTASFNFGVLAGQDEHISLYSAILNQSLISV